MHQTKHGRRLAVAIIASSMALTAVAPAPTAFADHPSSIVGAALGDEGEDVRAVQQALIDQGISLPGGVDGVYGAGTEAAVQRLQAQHGLNQTGRVDTATAIALGLKQSNVYGLRSGDRGDRVRALQQRLIDLGFDVGSSGADGIFGDATAAAVEAFQRSKSFLPTGKVNAATAAALGDTPVPAAAASGEAVEAAEAGSSAERTSVAEAEDSSSEGSTEIEGLGIGSTGPGVVRVQQALIDAGFTVVGGADGIYGALTAAAVQSFQGVNGLEVTGEIDAATAAAIRAIESAPADEHRPEEHDPTVSSPLVGLKYGAVGSDVVALQQALIAAGHRPAGGADGAFGPATRGALEAFQAEQGLEVTGQVDEATAAALSSGSGASSSMVGLRSGSLGSVVVELQTALERAGFRPRGGADGIFGPATAEALKDFQTSQGLDATGVVDDATASALIEPGPSAAAKPDTGPAAPGFAGYGEKGARVADLQQALVDAGIEVRGGVDGSFGGGTAAAVMEFQRQQGLPVTGKVDEATASALGLEPSEAPAAPDPSSVKLEVFPMQGPCSYSDTWLYARGGGRQHLGVDILGAEGLLLYAVTDGTITKVYEDQPGSLSGNGVRLTQPDGTYFFYAHMVSVADGIEVGTQVKAGQVLGYNGATGNTATPHLHLEVHPQGGAAVNPYPLVKAIDACDVTEPLPQP